MKSRPLFKWLLLLFLIAVFARIVPGPRTIDDAYITFRYARNLLAGQGFSFNPGEPVLGTSTPLYTLFMAALGGLAGGPQADFPRIAWLLNAILDGFTAISLALVGVRLNLRWAGWATALAWAIAPFSVTFAIGGLETSLYVLLLIGACYSYINKCFALSAGLGSLALLTRPDALLLLVLLAFHRMTTSRREDEMSIEGKEWLALTLPFGLWAFFAWSYFGSPLPHSVLAKTAAYQLEPTTALIRLIQHYATPFQGHLLLGQAWIGVGLLLYPFLFVVGARHLFKSNRAVLPFALFPWLYFIVFAGANPLIFRWYLTPPLPFLFIFILVGLELLISQMGKGFNWSLRLINAISIALILAMPTLMLLSDWQAHPDHGQDQPAPSMAWIKLEILYEQAAEQLVQQPGWNRSQEIAAGDVGVLGYFTQAPVLDLVGLNSAQSLGYYPLPMTAYADFVYAIPTQLVLDETPDYLVFLEIYARHTLLKDKAFLEQYQLINELPSDIYGSRNMLIYKHLP